MDKNLEDILQELHRFGTENDSGAKDKSKRMRNVTPATGEFLSFMASLIKAKDILEIGTSNGYSTLWLANIVSQHDGLVTTLEYSSDKAVLAQNNFEQARMQKWINLVIQDAGEYIKKVNPNSFDMIFLDSERKEYVEWWGDLRKRLKNNGLMIVDNTISHRSELEDFLKVVSTDKSFTAFHLPIENGLLLLKKESK